ncbi:MAG: ParA family protein [Chloroflexi bacterium]|nr:ParA family protein [Chloroflexota bacterium]MBP8000868.1 ParA family protein [Chloroflexota bacterium]MBP8058895.1 ParA family protein [Chloroflexota bacterium]
MAEAITIAVVNRKGGVGKTTTAASLAHGLARKVEAEGGRVLLIDLDPQGHASRVLGVEANGADLAQLLLGQQTIKQAVVSADRSKSDGPSRPNLFVIPTSNALAAAKTQLVVSSFAQMVQGGATASLDDLLEQRLGKLRQAFRYIIFDCPPSLDVLERSVYRMVQHAIVPVKTDYLGVVGTLQHTTDIVAAQTQGMDVRVSMVVPTFMRPNEVLARQVVESLVKQYTRKRVSRPVPQRVALEQCVAEGKTIFEYEPDNEAAKSYQDLVDKVYAL